MLVLAGEQFACIKISGRANFTSSIDFRTLITELRQKGYTFFVLDLSECALMDSTFLGVLAGFGLKMSGAGKDGGRTRHRIAQPQPPNHRTAREPRRAPFVQARPGAPQSTRRD